jgi:hypothetical protein
VRVNALDKYEIPEEYKKKVESVKETKYAHLLGLTSQGPTKDTYKDYFRSLIWVEEVQMKHDIKKYGTSYKGRVGLY